MGLAGPTGATSKQEGSLAWAVGITLNGYPLHTPSHARVPAEPQSGPTNSFGRCKCWVLILADRGWPGVRGVKGIPIYLKKRCMTPNACWKTSGAPPKRLLRSGGDLTKLLIG